MSKKSQRNGQYMNTLYSIDKPFNMHKKALLKCSFYRYVAKRMEAV